MHWDFTKKMANIWNISKWASCNSNNWFIERFFPRDSWASERLELCDSRYLASKIQWTFAQTETSIVIKLNGGFEFLCCLGSFGLKFSSQGPSEPDKFITPGLLSFNFSKESQSTVICGLRSCQNPRQTNQIECFFIFMIRLSRKELCE